MLLKNRGRSHLDSVDVGGDGLQSGDFLLGGIQPLHERLDFVVILFGDGESIFQVGASSFGAVFQSPETRQERIHLGLNLDEEIRQMLRYS